MSRIAKPRRSESGTAAIDRISSLPGNVIDNILERLPIHDAASTSVLSKTWRDLWDLYPNLVFDWVFFSRIVANNDTLDEENLISEVRGTINEILLGNPGPILKFHLSVPEDLPLHETPNMDLWIKNISNNRVRQLKLIIGPLTAYKIPSYLFSCSELTHLSLTNCLLNPPLRFGGFCNLIDVTLENVIITGDMSFGTQLKELKLRFCSGIEHLESQFKQNYHLITFLIHKSGEIDLKWFECTKKLRTLGLLSEKGADSRKSYINLEKLLGNMIEIRTIHFNGSFLKLLESSAAVSKRLITTTRKLSLYKVEFYDLVQIRHVLFLMRSFPKLQRLEIIVGNHGMDLVGSREPMVSSVLQYLQSPNLVNVIFDQLQTVKIHRMAGSRAELHFIKFLLAFSPRLRWIELLNTMTDDPKEESRISKELMSFPRTSKVARIIWP